MRRVKELIDTLDLAEKTIKRLKENIKIDSLMEESEYFSGDGFRSSDEDIKRTCEQVEKYLEDAKNIYNWEGYTTELEWLVVRQK